jgi:DnaJ-class molecular chaperone
MGQGIPGMGPNIRIFHGGQMFQQQHQQQPKPHPILKNIQVTLEQCYTGCSVPIEVERWIYNGDIKCSEIETIYLTVPAGIDENESIMMMGRGHAVNDEIKGDIKINIQVTNDTEFSRRGLDLYYKKTVSLKDALCGFSFELRHLNGKTFCLNNNTNHTIIKPQFKKTIPNLGMIRENAQGSLIIEFDVEFPDSLTAEQIEVLKLNL